MATLESRLKEIEEPDETCTSFTLPAGDYVLGNASPLLSDEDWDEIQCSIEWKNINSLVCEIKSQLLFFVYNDTEDEELDDDADSKAISFGIIPVELVKSPSEGKRLTFSSPANINIIHEGDNAKVSFTSNEGDWSVVVNKNCLQVDLLAFEKETHIHRPEQK